MNGLLAENGNDSRDLTKFVKSREGLTLQRDTQFAGTHADFLLLRQNWHLDPSEAQWRDLRSFPEDILLITLEPILIDLQRPNLRV
jgi:hypothetical protein